MSGPTLAPEVVLATNPIRKLFPLPDGGLALATGLRDDLELFDSTLTAIGSIPGLGKSLETLIATKSAYLVRGSSLPLHESTLQSPFAPTKLGKENCRALVATPAGFLAFGTKHVLCDNDGNRSVIDLPGRLDFGATAYQDGAISAGKEGLAFVSASGEITKQTKDALSGPPVVFANGIICDDVVMNREAWIVTRLGVRGSRKYQPFREGLVFVETDPKEIVYQELRGDQLAFEWKFEPPGHVREVFALRDRVVVCCDTHTFILDGNGQELARLEAPAWIWAAIPFGDGIALHVSGSRDILWWREGHDGLVPLRHDVQPLQVLQTSSGLASAEQRALYVWRPDAEGPEHVPEPSPLPLGEPLVVNGALVKIIEPGRVLLRARTHQGTMLGIPRDATSRPAITRPRARELVKLLINRKFDEAIPPLVSETAANYSEASSMMPRLYSLPPEETASLIGREMFAPAALPDNVRNIARTLRSPFLDELGAALGVSRRVLHAAIRARRLPLEPPSAIKNYEYLGRFTGGDTVFVCDPCYLRNTTLRIPCAVHVGTWHVFVRNGSGEWSNRTAELVVIHERGFTLTARRRLGDVGVDSGNAGVFDKSCPKPNLDDQHEEGVFDGRAAFVSTGLGDGMYPAYAGDVDGRVAKIRIHFALDDEPGHDASLELTSTQAAKRYAISERFAMGEAVEHPKYGVGTVVEVGTDDKIAVRFPDGITRRLIHGKA